MINNPIPGNIYTEREITADTTAEQLQEWHRLLLGAQDSDRRGEPRYLAESDRIWNAYLERSKFLGRRETFKVFAWSQDAFAAVQALNNLTGHETDPATRDTATEILLGLVPPEVEQAFTDLMERTERWNEED